MRTPTDDKIEFYNAANAKILLILRTLVNESKLSANTYNSIAEQLKEMDKNVPKFQDVVKTVWDKGYDHFQYNPGNPAERPIKGKAFDLEAHTVFVIPHNKNANRD